LHFFCEKNLTGHKLKKTLSGPFLVKKIVDLLPVIASMERPNFFQTLLEES